MSARTILNVMLTVEMIVLVVAVFVWGIRSDRRVITWSALVLAFAGAWMASVVWSDTQGLYGLWAFPLAVVLGMLLIPIVALALSLGAHESRKRRQDWRSS